MKGGQICVTSQSGQSFTNKASVKSVHEALVDCAQWLECWPVYQSWVQFLVKAMYLGCGFHPWSQSVGEDRG